jgi:hypothetical protein
MPYASLFTHHVYGEAAMASVTVGTGATDANIKGFARGGATTTGTGSVSFAKPTRLVNSPATIAGVGAVITALPKGRARPSATIRVNVLSQDDVTGAVLESEVEPGISLKHALRLTLAALAGKVSGAAGTTVTFRNPADTKNRITATVDASGNRSAVSTDLSDG